MSADPGINHRDVDAAEKRFGAIDAFQRHVAFCYIANQHVRLASELANALCNVGQSFLATRHENDSCTAASCMLRERATDARRRPRDQNGTTSQGA
jgi:hypothetical protein